MEAQLNEIETARTLSAKYENDTAMMLFSAITYCSLSGGVQPTLTRYFGEDWTLAWESKEKHHAHYAFIAYNKNVDAYVVAIRGTVSNLSFAAFENWFFEDFKVDKQVPWKYPSGPGEPKISEGANTGLDKLIKLKNEDKETMFDFLRNIKEGDSIWVTGHSLGGALATIYSSWLFTALNNIKSDLFHVVSFAGPTVGNADFASQFNNKFVNSRRYVNGLDIVSFMADNIEGMTKLYDGTKKYAPKASDIPQLYGYLEYVYQRVKKSEEDQKSVYTPVKGKMPLNTKNDLFYNNMAFTFERWFAQAGSQHSHVNYLNFMDWGHGDFGCIAGNIEEL